jgi:hypothetical protein
MNLSTDLANTYSDRHVVAVHPAQVREGDRLAFRTDQPGQWIARTVVASTDHGKGRQYIEFENEQSRTGVSYVEQPLDLPIRVIRNA